MKETKQPVVNELVPVGFRVLLNLYKKGEQTSSGFILPEQETAGMPALGQITLCGKKTAWQKILILMGLKPRYTIGQWVYFRKYSVDEMIIETPDGKLNLYILEENEIIGIAKMI
jgi:co-chaperonin GroES (HSP10)